MGGEGAKKKAKKNIKQKKKKMDGWTVVNVLMEVSLFDYLHTGGIIMSPTFKCD